MRITTRRNPYSALATLAAPRSSLSVRLASASLLCAAALSGAITPVAAQSAKALFDDAYYAWDEGRYVDALTALQAVLAAPDAATMHRQVALLTGELYTTYELTTDGASPRWSPDGRMASFETGNGDNVMTHVFDTRRLAANAEPEHPMPLGYGHFAGTLVKRATQPTFSVAGRGMVFSKYSDRAAYLGPTGVVMRFIDTAVEQNINVGTLDIDELFFGPDNRGTGDEVVSPGVATDALFAIASNAGADPQIWRLGSSALVPVTDEPGGKSGARVVTNSFDVVYSAGRGGGFGIASLATGQVRQFDGASPDVSATGAIVYLGTDGGQNTIEVLRPEAAEPTRVYETANDLDSPAISPDGRTVAFQMMPREDWEIYALDVDEAASRLAAVAAAEAAQQQAAAAGGGGGGRAGGGRGGRGGRGGGGRGGRGGPAGPTGPNPITVTSEIQHDLSPHFLSNDLLLGLIGEARHRRSYAYDLTQLDTAGGSPEALAAAPGGSTPHRIRLHHNNTVRTAAPEYDWVPSPDGSKLLLVADRDGDTVSQERGVYLMDMSREVTNEELVTRVNANLRREQAMRSAGTRAFEPIATAVRDVVNTVSTARIYGYASDVFSFGSKYVTEPGNAKAIAYYETQLRSMGYEPELQWFDARGVQSANIVARLPGTVDPDLVYVVSSHFDSVNRGPGADDDSSGATALLEAARVLKDHPMPATIEFAFFTGEEAGLLGSREFVRRAVESGKYIAGALNNDMIGFANNQRLDNTIRYSNEGIRDIQHAAAFLFTNLILYDAKYYRSTDAAAYYEAYGDIVGGIGSYPILGNPHYHQSHDVLETINQQLVAEVSKTTVGTLMMLASSPARLKDLTVVSRNGDNVEVSWSAARESDVTGYVVAYGPVDNPLRESVQVSGTSTRVRATPGTVVSVKAINRRGLQSWDWAHVIAQ